MWSLIKFLAQNCIVTCCVYLIITPCACYVATPDNGNPRYSANYWRRLFVCTGGINGKQHIRIHLSGRSQRDGFRAESSAKPCGSRRFHIPAAEFTRWDRTGTCLSPQDEVHPSEKERGSCHGRLQGKQEKMNFYKNHVNAKLPRERTYKVS